MVTIDIPVLPHVKSLLLSIYGSEPISANENNILGKKIESILLTYVQTEFCQQKLIGDQIKITLSHRVSPYYAAFKNAFVLGCFFEKEFHLLLYTYVGAQMEAGIKQETAIKNFYTRHCIDPEGYNIIAARMSLMRMRKRKAAAA